MEPQHQRTTPDGAPTQDPTPYRTGALRCHACDQPLIPFLPGQDRHLWDNPDGGTLQEAIERDPAAFRRLLSRKADDRLAELEATQTWRAVQ
jgi:hypothetical protein